MINTLRSIDPSLVLLSPLLALIWLASLLVKGMSVSAAHSQDVFKWFSAPLDISFAVLITLLAAFAANRVIQTSVILGRISNFPMFFIILLAFIIPIQYVRTDFALLIFLEVLVLQNLVEIPEGQKPAELTFNIGALIGIMTLIEPWSVLFSVPVFQALLSTGLFNFKRLMIYLLGLLTPLYFLTATYFLLDKEYLLPKYNIDPHAIADFSFNAVSGLRLMVMVFIFGFVVYSLLQVQTSTTLREKRKWQLVISMALVSFVVLIFNDFGHGITFILLPASVVLSKVYLVVQPNRLLNMSLLLLVTLVLVANFF